MKKLMKKKELAILLTISWMSVIFYLSHQPAEESSELSGSIVQLLFSVISFLPFTIDIELAHFYVRKSAHFFAYFILGVLVFHSVKLFLHRLIPASIGSFFITILYAISDEFHQSFIPGRSGEVRDVLIDSAGSLTGILTYIFFILLYNKLGNQLR